MTRGRKIIVNWFYKPRAERRASDEGGEGAHYSIRSIYHRSRCILLRVRALIWDSAHNFYYYTFSELIRFFILYYFIVTRTVHLSISVSETAASAFHPSPHTHARIFIYIYIYIKNPWSFWTLIKASAHCTMPELKPSSLLFLKWFRTRDLRTKQNRKWE